MDTSPAGLAQAATCFTCMTDQQLLAVQVYLLSLIVTGGGGGSSGNSLQFVAYTVAPPPNPPNTAAYAIAFDPTGNLSTLFWNPGTQSYN